MRTINQNIRIMNNRLLDKLWDFIVNNSIATTEEVNLVTDINGYNEEALNDIIYARTGYRDYEQCMDDNYAGDADLDVYYGISDESEED